MKTKKKVYRGKTSFGHRPFYYLHFHFLSPMLRKKLPDRLKIRTRLKVKQQATKVLMTTISIGSSHRLSQLATHSSVGALMASQMKQFMIV